MIDLDRYVCPGPNCLKTLEEHRHSSDDADPTDHAGIQLWPDGGWAMSCSCGWEFEGGPETRHPDAVPSTLRNTLPADVVKAVRLANRVACTCPACSVEFRLSELVEKMGGDLCPECRVVVVPR